MKFRKVLVSNRGEIARRVMRTCTRLGLSTVAIYSEADRESPHVSDADESVCVGPPQAKESYLNIPAVLDAIKKTGADVVHPGYGFLSEKSDFARAVADAGVTFVGPPPNVLDAFGDKMKARHVALAAGTSPVPGTNEPIPIDTPEQLAAAKAEAERIGLPLVVKAVGGGGGIGMQIVRDLAQLDRALKSCSDRGKASFADARVYMERYASQPRHIEVQVFADTHGNFYALGLRLRGRELGLRTDGNRLVRTGHRRGPRGERDVARLHLVAERVEHVRRRSDERDAGVRDRARERRVLAQEAVARVDDVRAGLLDRVEHRREVQVRLLRGRGPDEHRFVRVGDVRALAIGFRVDGHGLQTEPLARANHAARNFSAVRDEDFSELHLRLVFSRI